MGKLNYADLTPLVKRVKAGDSNAFSKLYSATYQKVYFFSLSLTKSTAEAEDVVQETFINALKNIQTLMDDRLFIAWINRIAYNICMKHMNQPVNSSLDDTASLEVADESDDSDPLTVSMRNDQKREIVECIDRLPEKLRAVVVLKYYEGLKEKEIAMAISCPTGTVKSRLNTAKSMLKQMLEERN